MVHQQRHIVGCASARPRRRCHSIMGAKTAAIMATAGLLITLFSTASNGFCLPNGWNARILEMGKGGEREGALFMAYDPENDLSSSPKVWRHDWENYVFRGASRIVASVFIVFYGSVTTPTMLHASSAQASTISTEIRGIKITPMNSLTFNYRGGEFAGLDGNTLLLKDQPTISYQEFLEKLSNGEIFYVEFLAPNGDEAYVTLKEKGGHKATSSPLRIGDGYPIEKNDGWSSPAFTIRSLKDRGVPYKFVFPALEKYK